MVVWLAGEQHKQGTHVCRTGLGCRSRQLAVPGGTVSVGICVIVLVVERALTGEE